MDAHDAPLIGRALRWLEENNMDSLPNFFSHFTRNAIFPVLIAVFAFSGLASVIQTITQFVIPRTHTERYIRAKSLYRTGQHKEALKEWEKLETFGPAYLSRATHALYVDLNPQQTLGILRMAKEKKVKIQLKQVEMIKMDAKVLQSGAGVTMIDMNGRLAKQEHLGITTW